MFTFTLFAQNGSSIVDREKVSCLEDRLHEAKMATDPIYRQQQERLEQRTFQLLSNHKHSTQKNNACSSEGIGGSEVLIIPVVVHILHASDAELGDFDENPDDNQIERAMEHLNDAFRNRGDYAGSGRGANDTQNPDRTLLRSQDTQIEFRLAQRDIRNRPSNGIIRYQTDEYAEFDSNLDSQMKAWVAQQNGNSYPTNAYANIYLVNEICDGSGRNAECGVAGYAYLAGSHGRPFDGILNEMRYFGVSEDRSKVHIHEFGHYLNLRHTFQGGCGTNNCLSSGDGVCDTPPDNTTDYTSCGRTQNSCDSDEEAGFFSRDQDDMYENYMDYSDLRCQNTFTQGQKDRMRAALLGIRSSLLTSKGSIPVGSTLATITDVVAPKGVACEQQITPTITISNSGDQAIRSLQLQYELGGQAPRFFNWNGQIGARATQIIQLPLVNLNAAGTYTFNVQLVNINGEAADGTVAGACQSFHYAPSLAELPYCQPFNENSIPLEWFVENPDGENGFQPVRIRGCEERERYALQLETWNRFPDQTTVDELYLQPLDLRSVDEAYFDFDVAYATTFPNFNTFLEVAVSTDCGLSYQRVYRKTASDLATTSISASSSTDESAAFVPNDCSDWKKQSADLSAFVGRKVLVRIQASTEKINASPVYEWGNNLYLDNFCLTSERCAAPNTVTPESIEICGQLEVNAQVANISEEKSVFWWITSNQPVSGFVTNQRVLESAVGFTPLGNAAGLASEGNILFRSNSGGSNLNIPVDCESLSVGVTYYATPVLLNTNLANPFFDDCTFGRPVSFTCGCDANTCNIRIAEVTVQDATACGVANGAITIRASEAVPTEYSLNGTNWQQNNRFAGLASGNYQVFARIIGDNSCEATQQNITVGEPDAPTVNRVDGVAPTCDAENGRISIIMNGNDNFQFRLHETATWVATNSFENLAAGTYNIAIRKAAAPTCVTTTTFTLEATTDTIVIDNVISTAPSACGVADGQVIITTTVTGVEYSLNGIDWQRENIFSNLTSGTYTPQVRKGDCASAVADAVTLVATGTGIEIEAELVDRQACLRQDNELFFTITGGTPPYRIVYTLSNKEYVVEEYVSEAILTIVPSSFVSLLKVVEITDATACAVESDAQLLFYAASCSNNRVLPETSLQVEAIQPNPFRESTQILIHSPASTPLQLTIFDATGRTVLSESKTVAAGVDYWTIQASQLQQVAGLYYYTIKSAEGQVSGKLVLIE
jgi:hypothetical protein